MKQDPNSIPRGPIRRLAGALTFAEAACAASLETDR